MAKSRLARWINSSDWSDRLLAVVSVSPIIVLVVRQFRELGDRAVPCCDFAVLELGTRAFLRGEQLLGLYSREGWRHPGPAPFAWSSLFRPLPGNSFAEHQIAAATLALIALITVVAATWGIVHSASRSAVLALVAVFIWRFDLNAMRVPWNPYGALMWTLIAVVSTARFTQNRSAIWAGIAVLAGSMAAQFHVGAAPTFAVCVVTIAVVMIRHRRRRDIHRPMWSSGVVLSVMWFVPLADLAFGTHNLAKIAGGSNLTSEPMDGSAVWTAAMWLVGHAPQHIGETFGPASAFVDVRDVIVLDVVALIVVLGLASVALVRWRVDRFAAVLTVLSMGSLALTVAALLVSNGPFLRYLLLPVAGLGLVLWISAGMTMIHWLQRHEKGMMKILVWPIVVACTAMSIVQIDTRNFTDAYTDGTVQQVIGDIEDACETFPSTSVLSIEDTLQWFDAVPIVVAVERCSTVRIIGPVAFLAGQPYAAEFTARPNVFLTAGTVPANTSVVSQRGAIAVSIE